MKKFRMLAGMSLLIAVLALGGCVPVPAVQPAAMVEEGPIPPTKFRDVVVQGNLEVLGTTSTTGASTALANPVFEGATDDAYETTFAITDPTADRTITVPNLTGVVMLGASAGRYVVGVNTITNTLAISHGLTTPQAVFCTLIQDSEANAATCSATISSSTVTIKVWKADGTTAGSVGKQVAWMVTGQP